MTQPADLQAREAGIDLQHSYIVQAPAGSGKTELLIQRMLCLLAHVDSPEEVVAITFTRKAAAEMSRRLVLSLQAAASQPDDNGLKPHQKISHKLAQAVLANDEKKDWGLLQQPNRLRVRTIDSLCSELARQLPVLSGLGGGQQIADDAEALYRQAAIRTMAALEDDGDELQADVICLLNRYDNQYDKLVELLTGMLANREQWAGHLLDLRKGSGFDRQGLEAALRFLIETELEKALQLTPDTLLAELPQFFTFALGNSPGDETRLGELLASCGSGNGGPLNLSATAEALPHWQTMINRLLTQGGEWRKDPNKSAGFPSQKDAKKEDKDRFKALKAGFRALLDQHRENDRLRSIYDTIRTLPRPDYEDEAWESLESLMRLLLRATQEWNVVIAESGELDYGEVAHRAIESLGSADAPSDLALRMDYRIQHLLVDEFQDTSSSQVELLQQLTAGWSDGDGRTLFLVGDPMQSIYRFRKAEVSLFLKAWDGDLFDHIQLLPLELKVNFRSTRPIVEWVNEVFPTVMPRVSDPVMGAVHYCTALTKPDVSADGGVAIEILPERDDEQEAQQVVAIIEKSTAGQSIAILVRSRSHASEILAELDRRKLQEPRFRYQAIKFTKLADTTLIQDLVSLTVALLQPADRLAWLATLRAPYIGLNLADLDALVAGDADRILLDNIRAYGAGQGERNPLGKDGQLRLLRTAPILKDAVDRQGRQSVRSLVESAWVRLGGPACAENASELDDAATYFGLLDSLETEDLPIDRDTLDVHLEKLYAEPDSAASGELQVMTIYAAKGLQFDTVILPGLNRRTGNDKAKLLHWFELAGEDKIVMSPMRNTEEKEQQKKGGDLISYITDIEKQRQGLEAGRVLYVAATRAVRNLHLFAAIKPSAKGEIKPQSGSLMGCLWPAVKAAQVPLLEAAVDTGGPAETGTPPVDDGGGPAVVTLDLPRDYRRLSADWKLPAAPASVSRATAEYPDEHDYIEFSWAGEDARLAGNLVHRLLQLVGEQGLDSWKASGGISARTPWCRQQLASAGIQQGKADTIIANAAKAVGNCLISRQGRWILADHEDAHCEYAITAVTASQPRRLVLDRTFIDNDIRWIIDYKTSSHSGGNLEGFLDSETERYREQLRRYREAIAMTETRPIKTALYFPLLDRLCEVD